MKKIKYGNVFALKEHMLNGKKITRLESILLFGVQNFTAVLSNIKKDGYIIKKEPVAMAKVIIRRINKYTSCKPPKNLPIQTITCTNGGLVVNMSLKLRPWQSKAVNKALEWLLIKKRQKIFNKCSPWHW